MPRRPSQSHSPISTTIATMLSRKSARGSADSFSTATPAPSASLSLPPPAAAAAAGPVVLSRLFFFAFFAFGCCELVLDAAAC